MGKYYTIKPISHVGKKSYKIENRSLESRSGKRIGEIFAAHRLIINSMCKFYDSALPLLYYKMKVPSELLILDCYNPLHTISTGRMKSVIDSPHYYHFREDIKKGY